MVEAPDASGAGARQCPPISGSKVRVGSWILILYYVPQQYALLKFVPAHATVATEMIFTWAQWAF